jgi:serine/threonine protein kinase
MTERFTLLTELGRGGMGVVWKARDEETGQIVALKLLRETYAEDPDYVTRFERELELAKRIHSRNVVQVLGYGVRDKTPYLALEFVDGPSLRERLASHGAYSWTESRPFLAQIAQGLADAHAAGVVHRDLKPSNVLIGSDGVAKLADFGIAKGLDLTRMTGTSTLLGTPAYLPPEGPADERSDLYSLGVIAYEILTGVVPFEGRTYQEVILRHVREAPNLERLPTEARPVVGWLLAKDAADRPQRTADLLPVIWGGASAPAHAPPSATSQAAASAPPLPFRPFPPRPAQVHAAPPSAPAPFEPVRPARPLEPQKPVRDIPHIAEWRLAQLAPQFEPQKPGRASGPAMKLNPATAPSIATPASSREPLLGWLILSGAVIAAASFALPWVSVSSSIDSFVAGGSYFAGGLGAQFGSAGSLGNSVYLVLGAAVAGWLGWVLLSNRGRIRDLRLLVGGLAAAAGVLIIVVMVAVVQTATGMLDIYRAADADATIGLGIGAVVALVGAAMIIGGALIVIASEPDQLLRHPAPASDHLVGWLILSGAVTAAASFALPWVSVSSSIDSFVAGGSYFAGGLGAQFGSAGSIGNSVYILLGATVAGWLGGALLSNEGRTRELRLLLGGLGAAAGVLIIVVMVAVMQTATGMLDIYRFADADATIGLGIGAFVALVGAAMIIGGALIAMASEPDQLLRRLWDGIRHD